MGVRVEEGGGGCGGTGGRGRRGCGGTGRRGRRGEGMRHGNGLRNALRMSRLCILILRIRLVCSYILCLYSSQLVCYYTRCPVQLVYVTTHCVL